MQQHQRSQLRTTKRIKRHENKTRKERTKGWACLVLSPFALILTLWLFAVTYFVLTMMSPADTSIDGESSNNNIASVESSVQSSLFNERPASSSNTDVSSALSGGKGKTVKCKNCITGNGGNPKRTKLWHFGQICEYALMVIY